MSEHVSSRYYHFWLIQTWSWLSWLADIVKSFWSVPSKVSWDLFFINEAYKSCPWHIHFVVIHLFYYGCVMSNIILSEIGQTESSTICQYLLLFVHQPILWQKFVVVSTLLQVFGRSQRNQRLKQKNIDNQLFYPKFNLMGSNHIKIKYKKTLSTTS